MGADRLDPEPARLLDEGVPDLGQPLVGVVEAPGVAGLPEGVGEVREHLPGRDRIALRVLLHLLEVGRQRAVVRQHLSVQEHGVPVADELGRLPGLLHDRGRERASLRRDRQGRERDQARVGTKEKVLEEDLAREAGARVVGAAVDLREDGAEERLPGATAHQLVLEMVALDVEDEFLTGEDGPGRIRVEGGLRGQLPGSPERAPGRLARAALEREQRRRRPAERA